MISISILFLQGCSSENDDEQIDGQLTDISFNMSWLPQGSMAGVITAIEKGYYAEEGLNVSAMRGFGGIRTVNELDQGMFEFGYGDPLAIILNRNNGGSARMIGALNSRWPAGLCYVNERNKLNTPADLAGLKVGGGQSSPMQVIVPEWLTLNGVNPEDVTMMQLEPSIVSAALIEGDIDAGECWQGNSVAVFQKRAREAGLTVSWIEYSDFNLPIYGNGIVTTDKIIAEQPELVAKFLRATYRGYAYAGQHQQEATEIMIKHYPTLDAAITAQQVMEMTDLIGDQPGALERTRVEATLNFLGGAYNVGDGVDVDEIYTTEFLPNNISE
ncbi:MAG: ABC transporter substrate-binding protein [Kordiimonadaceae bacterium]|nr:ABC transporter substrate-binding protein [Kordiimonadaceae bacterium]MBT6033697.1 ABC transporter substrate-binding protein [Kordiimonadaceae bacterium]